MLRKWIAIAVCVLPPAGLAAEPSLGDIMRKLEALRQQVQQQQILIDQLRNQMSAQRNTPSSREDVNALVTQEVDAAIKEKGLIAGGDVPYLKLGKGIDGLTLKGDLRLRYEYRDRHDQGKDNRDRMRTRLRLGGIWENSSEDWEIGVGLATGSSTPTSTNDTWSDTTAFDTGDIRTDYAYAKHSFDLGSADLVLIAGQQRNPFVSNWLLWDTDVRPAGFTLKADAGGFFGTVGWYDVYNAGNEISEMIGTQFGYSFKTDAIRGKIAVAYYSYDDSVWKDSDINGDGRPDYGNNDFTFQIGDILAQVSIPLGEKTSIKLFCDYFKNFGATGAAGQGFHMDPALDAESEDDGLLAGITVKTGQLSLSYAYAAIAENAANPYLVDATFGSSMNATDVEGHRVKAAYKLTQHCSISLMAQFVEAIERSGVGGVNRYEVDLNYKF